MKTARRRLTKRNAPRRRNTRRIHKLFTVEKVIIHARPVNGADATGRLVRVILPALCAQLMARTNGKARP